MQRRDGDLGGQPSSYPYARDTIFAVVVSIDLNSARDKYRDIPVVPPDPDDGTVLDKWHILLRDWDRRWEFRYCIVERTVDLRGTEEDDAEHRGQFYFYLAEKI